MRECYIDKNNLEHSVNILLRMIESKPGPVKCIFDYNQERVYNINGNITDKKVENILKNDIIEIEKKSIEDCILYV